ncbi:inactive dipeptidyl peptidase 10 [Oncorhynchus mykiss]|uniref:inactive dipeptidyl peptidase 10 n=1 Tax=Oncorhynchus mykiss TaxID=8022 RepID=UPI001878D1C5|nr:inactive dipeptidyl peptidase 10 [Oncorhynchus mykiss]
MIASTQQNMPSDMNGVAYHGPPRNWRGIGIALMVILMIISLVILSVIMLTPDDSLLLQRSCLTLEDLDKDNFKVHDAHVTWLNDDEVAFRTREGHILKHSLSENLTIALLGGSILNLNDTKFQVSPDQKYILLAYNLHLVFSKSFSASYVIYSVGTGEFLELNPHRVKPSALQYAAWGPHGNHLIYIFQNNLYYQPGVYSGPVRLSTTGSGSVINGLSDWTYEEEILQTYPAYWWSGDGVRLAYLSINNTHTPYVEIPRFTGGPYPTGAYYPYPKAGDNIPAVTLYVVNVFSPAHTLRMTAPVSFKNRGHYISMVKWTSGTRLAVRWLNRVQNQSVLSVCEATTGICSQEAPLFSRDGSMFYVTLPAAQGGHGEYRHIAVLPTQVRVAFQPYLPCFILFGPSHWDVMSLSGLDEDAEKIYFISTEASKHSRHLYRHCLTCTLSETCRFYKPQFNPSLTRVILHCLGYKVLEDNKPLSEALKGKRLPITHYSTITADHYDMHLKLGLPQGYEEGLHPLLIIVDGAPDTQAVTDRFSLGWPQVLSSIHSVALAWVDGKSGAAHGLRSPNLDPRKLSSQRVKDLLSVVEYLSLTTKTISEQSEIVVVEILFLVLFEVERPQCILCYRWLLELPYIDNRRIALYGKAFGGLLTLKMMAAANIFKCAAVMAPITDFKIYNAAFSERHLGLPTTQESFYKDASLLDDVVNLRDKNFLLLHGTADAHVHFQHTAELIDRLVSAKANYSLQIYPDEGHVLRRSHSDQHFRRTLTNFLQDCLAPMPPQKSDGQEDD